MQMMQLTGFPSTISWRLNIKSKCPCVQTRTQYYFIYFHIKGGKMYFPLFRLFFSFSHTINWHCPADSWEINSIHVIRHLFSLGINKATVPSQRLSSWYAELVIKLLLISSQSHISIHLQASCSPFFVCFFPFLRFFLPPGRGKFHVSCSRSLQLPGETYNSLVANRFAVSSIYWHCMLLLLCCLTLFGEAFCFCYWGFVTQLKIRAQQNEQLEFNPLQEHLRKTGCVVDVSHSQDEMLSTTNFHKWAEEKKIPKIVQFHAWKVRRAWPWWAFVCLRQCRRCSIFFFYHQCRCSSRWLAGESQIRQMYISPPAPGIESADRTKQLQL